MSDKVILLVEDNADDVELTLRALERNNIANQVIVARDGAEAVDCLFGAGGWAGRPPVRPAVVLLDLKLPKVDGLEVLRRIRADYSLGANCYIRKPVDFIQFADVVRQVGLFWLVLNEPPPMRG
jgi:two-component system response regulator